MDDIALAEHLPDVHELMKLYNERYFKGVLMDVKLEWSQRMTQCAGICMLKRKQGVTSVTIRLSRPLLQLRPFLDTINTLLHEMIHAYFFVLQGGSLDRDGHGPDFCSIMKEINDREGSQISIYHSFHEEVQHLRKHIWRCTGPCRVRPPFFGWVRRSMNRPPQPADSWWAAHKASCSGQFIKVEEPAKTEAVNSKATVNAKTTLNSKTKVNAKTPTEKAPAKSAFFPAPKIYTCVSCEQFRTPQLDELNSHLDECLASQKSSLKAQLDEKGRLVYDLD